MALGFPGGERGLFLPSGAPVLICDLCSTSIFFKSLHFFFFPSTFCLSGLPAPLQTLQTYFQISVRCDGTGAGLLLPGVVVPASLQFHCLWSPFPTVYHGLRIRHGKFQKQTVRAF